MTVLMIRMHCGWKRAEKKEGEVREGSQCVSEVVINEEENATNPRTDERTPVHRSCSLSLQSTSLHLLDNPVQISLRPFGPVVLVEPPHPSLVDGLRQLLVALTDWILLYFSPYTP